MEATSKIDRGSRIRNDLKLWLYLESLVQVSSLVYTQNLRMCPVAEMPVKNAEYGVLPAGSEMRPGEARNACKADPGR
jgi:hypothetical protein